MKVTETALSKLVASFLLQGGGRVFAEVPILGQSADLVWVRSESITFIEVKINATRRAIMQCLAHELVADHICIATTNKTISQENLSRMLELGYGLISCNVATGQCSWLVEPRRLTKYWAPIRDRVISRIGIGEQDGN